MIANYIKRKLDVDISFLSEKEKKCLSCLVKVASPIDKIYWRQVNKNGYKIKNFFEKITKYAGEKKPLFEEYLEYFILNHSFYNSLDSERKFFPGFTGKDIKEVLKKIPDNEKKNFSPNLIDEIFSPRERPPGINIYDEGITKEILEKEMKKSEKIKKEINKINTEIRLREGKIVYVPYEKVHRKELEQASFFLLEASKYAEDKIFKKYLVERAKALLHGNYKKSDEIWINAGGNLNITIGPIETYDDRILGQKGSYEAFIFVKDEEETKKFERIKNLAPEFEKNLPCEEKYKNRKVFVPPLEVMNTVLYSGIFSNPSVPVGMILPNDEKIRKTNGYRILLSKNVSKAKFFICELIAKRILEEEELKKLKKIDDLYFLFTAMHELGHGNGKTKNPRGNKEELKEYNNVMDELKAYVLGLYNLNLLEKKEIITKEEKVQTYYSYLVDSLRKLREGIEEAHNKSVAFTLNYFLEEGAVETEGGKYKIIEKAEKSIEGLAKKLLEINYYGDYVEADRLIKKYVFISEETKRVLERMKDLPKAVALEYLKIF